MSQKRQMTKMGFPPIKEDNAFWGNSDRKALKFLIGC